MKCTTAAVAADLLHMVRGVRLLNWPREKGTHTHTDTHKHSQDTHFTHALERCDWDAHTICKCQFAGASRAQPLHDHIVRWMLSSLCARCIAVEKHAACAVDL